MTPPDYYFIPNSIDHCSRCGESNSDGFYVTNGKESVCRKCYNKEADSKKSNDVDFKDIKRRTDLE